MDFLPQGLAALGDFSQFILYILVPSEKRPGKNDKFPIDYRTGQVSNAHDPSIWLDVSTALKLASQYKSRYGHGIGFVLTENDPFFFLDIDNCLEIGAWSPLAVNLMTAFAGAAIEISSSQKGLHIIGTGPTFSHSCKNTVSNLELYTSGRFVALTGDSVVGSAATDCSHVLPWLIANYFPVKTNDGIKLEWTDSPRAEWNGSVDDHELINRALRSQSARSAFGGGASFRDLWDGNLLKLAEVYGGDESSYDAALAQHLAFWTGNDCERMLRLMRQSSLVRDKWEREDYLPRTILSACAKQTEWLSDKPPQEIERIPPLDTAPRGKVVTGNTYLTIEQQLDLFKGCVYICDIHKILVPGGGLLKPDQFRVMFGGFSFTVDPANARVTRNAWEAFTESQALQHNKADTSCFKPDLPPGEIIEKDGRTLVNLWWPIQTPRKLGDATPFLTHLKKILPDDRDQTILLSYMSACVQYLGRKFEWTPLLQGVEGNGKTLFTRCLAFAIGDRYSHFPNAAEITEKYNDWMYGTLFVGVEDIYVADSRLEVLETLKVMITNKRLEIRAMHSNKVMRDVCCNFLLNSNHKDGIRKTRNDRRFATFYTAQQSLDDLTKHGMTGDYFPQLYTWLQHQDGYAIVSELLHSYQIPEEFNPATKCKRAPETSSTEDAITQGLGGIEQEIMEAVEQGTPGFRGGWISSIALDQLLTRLNRGYRISHNRRRDVLRGLGYDWHPGLNAGRVNNIVLPDGGKPRLFVRHDHMHKMTAGASEIARLYAEAQQIAG